jgi:hypothetical protein
VISALVLLASCAELGLGTRIVDNGHILMKTSCSSFFYNSQVNNLQVGGWVGVSTWRNSKPSRCLGPDRFRIRCFGLFLIDNSLKKKVLQHDIWFLELGNPPEAKTIHERYAECMFTVILGFLKLVVDIRLSIAFCDRSRNPNAGPSLSLSLPHTHIGLKLRSDVYARPESHESKVHSFCCSLHC